MKEQPKLDFKETLTIELRRESIYKRAQEARKNYNKGNFKSGTVLDLLKDLEKL